MKLHTLFTAATLALLALVLMPVAAAAEASAPATGAGFAQMLLGLAAVVALILGIGWVLRQTQAGPMRASRILSVVASHAVGTRERVVVIEIEGSWMVLGVAPGHVSRLARLPKPVHAAESSTPTANAGFSVWLDKALKRT
jgi:flagellar protein FliO/FliZ